MLFCVAGIRHNIRKPPFCDFHAFLLFCHQPPPLGYSNSLSPPMRPSGSSQTWVTQFASRWQCLFHSSLLSGIAALPGRRYAICPRQRLSAFGAALQSCPALALQGKSPSLAVVSPYGAPMPHRNFWRSGLPPALLSHAGSRKNMCKLVSFFIF